MFIELLQRRMLVSGEREAAEILAAEPGVWNVVSIREAHRPLLPLPDAKDVCRVAFADLVESTGWFAPRRLATARDLAAISAFAKRTHPEPLLVHCLAGISRSTAVALGIIARAIHPHPALARESVEILRRLCPRATPNRLVLTLALEQFLPRELARGVADEMKRLTV